MRQRGARRDNGNQIILSFGGGFLCSTLDRHFGQAERPTEHGLQIRIGGSDLGGVVTSAKGPEAGVWVIAETADLPTKFAKIVVTDDQGRYVIPGLPNATL